MGIDLTIRDDDLLPKPRAIRNFVVTRNDQIDWEGKFVGFVATAMVATDDTARKFTHRKIAHVVPRELLDEKGLESLTEKMRDTMTRCDHEKMAQKAREYYGNR